MKDSKEYIVFISRIVYEKTSTFYGRGLYFTYSDNQSKA